MVATTMSAFARVRGLRGRMTPYGLMGSTTHRVGLTADTRALNVITAPATDDAKGVVSWEATV